MDRARRDSWHPAMIPERVYFSSFHKNKTALSLRGKKRNDHLMSCILFIECRYSLFFIFFFLWRRGGGGAANLRNRVNHYWSESEKKEKVICPEDSHTHSRLIRAHRRTEILLDQMFLLSGATQSRDMFCVRGDKKRVELIMCCDAATLIHPASSSLLAFLYRYFRNRSRFHCSLPGSYTYILTHTHTHPHT